MSRLLVTAAIGILISFPPPCASAAEPANREDTWQELHSVVSHRGVRVNLVQAAEEVAEDAVPAVPAAEESVLDSAPATTAAPEAPPEADAAPPAPAAEPVTEESESPGDQEALAPEAEPEACGPVRARIHDLEPPAEIPMPTDAKTADKDPSSKGSHGKGGYGRDTYATGGGIRGAILQGRSQGAACASNGYCAEPGGCRFRGRLSNRHNGSGGGCGAGGCGIGGGRGMGGGRGAGNNFCWCEMPQHLAYFPEMHGYYYFRPYNWSKIAEHQQITTEWGEDPRNPYGDLLFQQVYADFLAEQNQVEVPPLVEPDATAAPIPPEGN